MSEQSLRIEKDGNGTWRKYRGEEYIGIPSNDELLLWEYNDKLVEALKGIVGDLPTKRDWLNPDLEKLAREAIAQCKPQKG